MDLCKRRFTRMDDTGNEHERQVLLSDPAYLFADCWAIPYAAERELGAAAQTLGAFERLCSKTGKTFASIDVIAEWACLPRRTVLRHIPKLIEQEWIQRVGREKRRTITYKATEKFKQAARSPERRLYPRFSGPEWTWSMRVVFAVVANAQLASFIGTRNTTGDMAQDMGEDFVLRSVSAIASSTGLTKPSVTSAIKRLTDLGYLNDDQPEFETAARMLYVNNVPMPQRGCKKVAQVEWKKMAQLNGHDRKKVALGVEKNGTPSGKKWHSQLLTTLNTTSKYHPQALAEASPEGFSFLCLGEDGREELPSLDRDELLAEHKDALAQRLIDESALGRADFFCAVFERHRTGRTIKDILNEVRDMLPRERYDWQTPRLGIAKKIYQTVTNQPKDQST